MVSLLNYSPEAFCYDNYKYKIGTTNNKFSVCSVQKITSCGTTAVLSWNSDSKKKAIYCMWQKKNWSMLIRY